MVPIGHCKEGHPARARNLNGAKMGQTLRQSMPFNAK